ncbi:hypothetical protein [Vannielia litorea]|uniref:hypothetical protein n=1 Tax=Vannielia litorea TaxID=1217970 RepID=UPI001C94B475|nr:hypothetical protein [Vannielia litorea]MBY6049078.1 hypothetical protein [Vannielia litorea]MBY6076492.1 hypothetical protein [Vannielia litorea]
MPFILGTIALLTAAYVWYIRAKGAADMAGELMNAAGDVRAAARRFGYKLRKREHPVDGIEEPVVAAAGIAEAFISLDDLPTRGQRMGILQGLQKAYRVDLNGAEEAAVLGRWLVGQCGSADAAISRIVKKLISMGGQSELQPLMAVLNTAAGADGASLGPRQQEALQEISRRFGL